jgi:hypothetical protein
MLIRPDDLYDLSSLRQRTRLFCRIEDLARDLARLSCPVSGTA